MKIPVTVFLSATATVTGPSSSTTLFETKTVPLANYHPGTTTKTPIVSGVHHIVGLGGGFCGGSGICPRGEQGPVINNMNTLGAVASVVTRGGDLDSTAAATGGIQMQDVKWTTVTGRASPPLPTAMEAPMPPFRTGYFDGGGHGPVVHPSDEMERLSRLLKTATPAPQPIATEAPVLPFTTGYLDKRDEKGPFPEIDWLGFAVESDAEGPPSAAAVERPVVQEHESKEGIWGYDAFGYRLPDACRKPHIGNCR